MYWAADVCEHRVSDDGVVCSAEVWGTRHFDLLAFSACYCAHAKFFCVRVVVLGQGSFNGRWIRVVQNYVPLMCVGRT